MKNQLYSKLPLPTQWSEPQQNAGQLNLQSQQWNFIGLASTNKDGVELVGTGSHTDSHVAEIKAYFELIERIAVFERRFEITASLPSWQMVKPALSNGVACHTHYHSACQSAALELVERDRILRSWYGALSPKLIYPLPDHPILSALTDEFEFTLLCLGQGSLACIGIPRKADLNLWVSYSCHPDAQTRLEKCLNEGLQRYFFLQGSEPTKEPSVQATPIFHLDYYLYPPNIEHISNWLSRAVSRCQLKSERLDLEEFVFEDLTPGPLQGKISVVRANSKRRLPLFFGDTLDFYAQYLPEISAGTGSFIHSIHPIA